MTAYYRKEIAFKTVLILLAVALNAAEYFIPKIPFLPWLKPGLANCITIVWIIKYGAMDALLFTFLRIWITGFYFGFSFLTISLSVGGGVCATLVMGLIWKTLGSRGVAGTTGTGVAGAIAHNAAQIFLIYLLFARNIHVFYQIPMMLFTGIIFGSMTGGLAYFILKVVTDEKLNETPQISMPPHPAQKPPCVSIVECSAVLVASFAVVFIDSVIILVIYAIAATVLSQALSGKIIKGILRPFTGFWLMFVFIACMHLFFSFGTRFEHIPFLTHEGVRHAILQSLRLWTWLELSFMLSGFNFHSVFIYVLKRAFSKNETSLYAGMLSLEYFPSTISMFQGKLGFKKVLNLLRHPVSGMKRSIENTCIDIIKIISRQVEKD